MLTFYFALSNLVMDLTCIHTSVVEASHWRQWWSNKRTMHECILVCYMTNTVKFQESLLQWCPCWSYQNDLSCVLHEWCIVVCTCPKVVKFQEQGVCVNSLIYCLVFLCLLVLESNTIMVIGSLGAEQVKLCKSQVALGYRILLLCCPTYKHIKWWLCYSFYIQVCNIFVSIERHVQL